LSHRFHRRYFDGDAMIERINRFTGKPQPYSDWGRPANYSCDDCGTGVICDCPMCGAPNCCPKCCDESRQELREEAAARAKSEPKP
jgi:hypothetical protein